MTSYMGTLSGANLNNVVDTGFYTLTAACTNSPPEAFVGALFHVEAHSDSYVIQQYLSINDPTEGWARIIRPSAGIYKPWYPLGRHSGFKGKTIVCFGDSVTEGGDYPARLASRLAATVVNGGFGGCRMGQHSQALYDPMCMYKLSGYVANGNWQPLLTAADQLYASTGDDNRSQSQALANLNWNAVDHVVIFFGTNDFSGSVPMGGDTDTTGATFKGAINATVTNILNAYPKMKLLFVTPLWRAKNGGSEVHVNGQGLYLRDYADAIISRAGAYKIEVLDLFRTCGINLLNHQHYLVDELHPTQGFGYQHVADKIGAALQARF